MFRIREIRPKKTPLNKENQFLYDFAQGYLKKNPPPPRPPRRRPLWRRLDYTVTTGIFLGIGWIWLISAERHYPAQPLDKGSKALQTPSQPNQHAPYTDIFAARIPLSVLAARVKGADANAELTKRQLEEAWARSCFSSKVLWREACLLGLFSRGKWEPGDVGDSEEGFSCDGQPRELMNGIMRVQREPCADGDSNGLLLSWRMPDAPRVFFETIAGWGYPWRLMSGGRHEMSVSEPYDVEGEEEKFIDVRFGSTHDYEIVHEEGDLSQQKILPKWVNRLHRGYSRLILESTLRGIVPPRRVSQEQLMAEVHKDWGIK